MKSFTRMIFRRGAIAPLAALLLIPLVGMLAFSIDMGYAVSVRFELQNIADAAALAGAGPLQSLFVQYNSPGLSAGQQSTILLFARSSQLGSPLKLAESAAALNKAGGATISVPDADVSFGYLNSGGAYTSTDTGFFPNTISVTVRRDTTANGPLSLFFGPLLGVNTTNLSATSRATIYVGNVSSLQPIPGLASHILPVGLDVKSWQNYMASGVSGDGAIHSGPNGNPQLQVYPDPGNAPGQFGLLDVGPARNDAPAFRTWIDSGETPNDIQYLLDNKLLPIAPASPQSWKGGPGLKSTLSSDFASMMGQPVLIPIFQAVQYSPSYVAASGSGSNSYYNIIGFVGATITQADGSGSSMNVSVQPAAVMDPTTIIMNPVPAGEQQSNLGTSMTTFVSAKLTY